MSYFHFKSILFFVHAFWDFADAKVKNSIFEKDNA